MDLNWLEENELSFATLIERCLCPRHRSLAGQKPEKVLATLVHCCSQSDGYLPQRLPLLESIFRLVLAKGNQPVSAENLASELSRRRGESLKPENIARLLTAEPHFYGLRAVPEPEEKASPPPASAES